MTANHGKSPALELRAFIDGVPALAWSALPEGSQDFFNRQFEDYTGLTSDQLHGSNWKSAVHKDDLQRLETWWHELGSSREAAMTEVRLRRFDGEHRWFQITAAPVHDDRGNLVRWYGINIDIDERKRAEQKTRQDEGELRTITDAIRQSIVVVAPDGTTLYANRVALDQTGLTVGDVSDKGFFLRAFHPDDVDRVGEERRVALLEGLPFELEMRILFKGGQYRWQLIQYDPERREWPRHPVVRHGYRHRRSQKDGRQTPERESGPPRGYRSHIDVRGDSRLVEADAPSGETGGESRALGFDGPHPGRNRNR